MLKNAIKIALGVKNCIPKIWRFFWKKLCTFLVAYVRKNVGKNRAKRFLENSSFLVRVAIYFLIPHEEFKTEKILHPNGDRDMICDVRAFLFIFKKVKCKIRIVYEKDFMRFYK